MIKNISQKKVLDPKSEIVTSFIGKAIGLILQKPRTLVFAFKKPIIRSLHSFLVHHPLDILFLNENKVVVEITRLKPYSMYRPKNKAKWIVELKDAKNTKIGDLISF